MSHIHVVSSGDSLSGLAFGFFGDPELSNLIADFNGLRPASRLYPGQRLHIPDVRDLTPSNEFDIRYGVAPPYGLEGILASFGNIYEYLAEDGTLDPRWVQENMRRVRLPYPLKWSLDPAHEVSSLVCHKRLAPMIPDLFRKIDEACGRAALRSFGGCYSFRTKHGANKLSPHCWGIALDLNPETNWLGAEGDMPEKLVAVFDAFGFTWGGYWEGELKEPMHFQFCHGY